MLYLEDGDPPGCPCGWDTISNLHYQLQASFKSLSTDGQTAFYRIDKPDYAHLYYDGDDVDDDGNSFSP